MDVPHVLNNGTVEHPPRMPWRWISLATFGIILLWPYPTVIGPALKLQVVDQTGQAVQQALVLQHWGYFGDNTNRAHSDGQGFVSFPEHRAWAPLGLRGLNSFWSFVSLHGGRRPYIWLAAYTTDENTPALEGHIFYDKQQPPLTQIKLHPRIHP